MGAEEHNEGQVGLLKAVLEKGLCTACGACVGICPYFANHRDATVVLHHCDKAEGRCYRTCPRTPSYQREMRAELYQESNWDKDIGPFEGLYLTRAADPLLRAAAQHGGTVSALTALALETGVADSALLTEQPDGLAPRSRLVTDAAEVPRAAGSKFVISPTVAGFNAAARGPAERILAVATPCQSLAFAKLRLEAAHQGESAGRKLALVIGLFCGWALSWRAFSNLLAEKLGKGPIQGMDIPPSRYQCLELYTAQGALRVDIQEVLSCVRENCRFCEDMTAEFADLSVGSARSPEGWEVDRGWNQLIVRTPRGRQLLEAARRRGALEFKEVPEDALQKLREASAKKKRNAARYLEAVQESLSNPA